MFEVFTERTVRPELVEGQSRIFPDEANMRHQGCGYMLRQAQHERFPGYLSLGSLLDLRANWRHTNHNLDIY